LLSLTAGWWEFAEWQSIFKVDVTLRVTQSARAAFFFITRKVTTTLSRKVSVVRHVSRLNKAQI